MSKFNIVASMSESTVVTEYEPVQARSDSYQSEAALEAAFIKMLTEQGYTYLQIHNSTDLEQNLRIQLEALNSYKFTDKEWERFFSQNIANANEGIVEKTRKIQEDNVQVLKRDNGETKNITLIDKKNIHNNSLQVINQYVENSGNSDNRYDVTVLVNGFPLVHIELKRRGVALKEAFNQIDRYQRDSFWAGSGLYEYVQIFVISNGTHTKYYSNTTRVSAIREKNNGKRKAQKTSNSFEFTSWWSDEQNNQLPDLRAFTETFFAKHTILNILTKYCVFTADKNLLVMRPYQIAATEKILRRVETAINNKWQGSTKAGGYIWHTTGSGKTLTSFKTAQLCTQLKDVEKVLFVVDRLDLDYQTMKEYDNFEKDCANSNSDYKILLRQLNDPRCHIIITTIQKLAALLRRKDDGIKVLQSNIVMIFDECHRSQFGKMGGLIRQKFKKYMIFGFTGTPIFAENAVHSKDSSYTTTEQAFGEQLHTYTIIDAIKDRNVLRFHVDYVSTMKAKAQIADTEVWGIEEDSALHAPERYRKVVEYILDRYAQKTKANEAEYRHKVLLNVSEVARRRDAEEKTNKSLLHGFNSIFAVDSIPSAIAYYNEFQRQLKERGNEDMKIATIFTYAANEEEDENGYIPEENPDDMSKMPTVAKDFLAQAINTYNETFGTSYDVSGDQFGNYYKDVSLRMKNRDIDLLIVVGMFLTGFDAKTLNTLWVDKNLKMHGLLQAYSRTNRILNSVKDCGNIVCFRNLVKQTNDSFAIFGDRDAGGIVIMRPFNDYYFGYTDAEGIEHPGYKQLVEQLLTQFPVDELKNIVSEAEQKEFIRQFGAILRAQNLLSAFDQFNPETEEERRAIQILEEGRKQDYLSWYNHLHEIMSHDGKGKVKIIDDVVFEMELVKQIQINIDYILELVRKYHDSLCKDKEIVLRIKRSIDASPDLRNKRDLIMAFIDRMTPDDGDDIYGDWGKFIEEQKEQELQTIIVEENLNEKETRRFVDRAFHDGYVNEMGTAVTKILPPMPLFEAGDKRQRTKERVLDRLKAFFLRFFNIG